MTLRINNLAAIVGVGYIIGLKYAAIICAGSFLSYFVLVPLVHAFGSGVAAVVPPGTVAIGAMSIDQVFKSYVRMIGIGGHRGAGVIGIVSAFPSMVRSIALDSGHGPRGAGQGGSIPRTDRSLTMKEIGLGLGLLAAGPSSSSSSA